MNTVTVAEAKKNLETLIAEIVSNVEPVIVRTEIGEQIVLVSLAEFNAWQETSYLLSNPANAAHLRQSIAGAWAGKTVAWEPPDL